MVFRRLPLFSQGTFLILQSSVREMLARSVANGVLVNVSSILGKAGDPESGAYAASKAGVIALTKSAAKEFGPKGIRCNAVLPGLTATPMTAGITEEHQERYLRNIPLGRQARPEEIAEVVKFLCSTESSYVNGAMLEATGGAFM